MATTKIKKFNEIYPTFNDYTTKVISVLNTEYVGAEWLDDTKAYVKTQTLFNSIARQYGRVYARFEDLEFNDYLINRIAEFYIELYSSTQALISNDINTLKDSIKRGDTTSMSVNDTLSITNQVDNALSNTPTTAKGTIGVQPTTSVQQVGTDKTSGTNTRTATNNGTMTNYINNLERLVRVEISLQLHRFLARLQDLFITNITPQFQAFLDGDNNISKMTLFEKIETILQDGDGIDFDIDDRKETITIKLNADVMNSLKQIAINKSDIARLEQELRDEVKALNDTIGDLNTLDPTIAQDSIVKVCNKLLALINASPDIYNSIKNTLQAGNHIQLTSNDSSKKITITALVPELYTGLKTALLGSSSITATPDDASKTITLKVNDNIIQSIGQNTTAITQLNQNIGTIANLPNPSESIVQNIVDINNKPSGGAYTGRDGVDVNNTTNIIGFTQDLNDRIGQIGTNKTSIDDIKTHLGDVSFLKTNSKEVVGSINEVFDMIPTGAGKDWYQTSTQEDASYDSTNQLWNITLRATNVSQVKVSGSSVLGTYNIPVLATKGKSNRILSVGVVSPAIEQHNLTWNNNGTCTYQIQNEDGSLADGSSRTFIVEEYGNYTPPAPLKRTIPKRRR